MLPVAVEIAPSDAQRDQVAALLTACSRAVADAECVLATEAPQGGAGAVAIITWQGEGQAFVEVGMRRDGRPVWRSRNVNFSGDDEPIERWRTVGFVVGTLARRELSSGAPTEPAPAPTDAPSAQPARVPDSNNRPPRRDSTVPTAPPRAAIDLGTELGLGLQSDLRTGGVLRTRWPIQDPLRALVSLKYMEQNDSTIDGRWFTLGAGVAWIFGTARTDVALGAEARAEYFGAEYQERFGASRSDSRWLAGVGLNATGAWMPMPALGLYLAVDGAWMFGDTDIRIPNEKREELVITDRPLRLGAGAGVRLRLW